jgi:hypothetical protein
MLWSPCLAPGPIFRLPTIELRGQADQSFIEWVQPDRDVFQIMVVS